MIEDRMTRRERIWAATSGKRADRLPFFHYWRHSQIGWAERECRNRGMGMNWLRPCYVEKVHGVKITDEYITESGHAAKRRTYSTPVGEVSSVERLAPGAGWWHGPRGANGQGPWQTERPIKGPEDYKVVRYIIENTEYVADHYLIEQAMEWLGDEGLVISALPYSPMQEMLINLVGVEDGRFFYHLADYPDLVDELYGAIWKSRYPLYEIAANAPTPIVACGDNLDAFLCSPRLFEKYYMPIYEQQAQVLHKHGKLMSIHMDGRLNSLKHLIAKTAVDIVEAFHPIPMNDLSLGEALSVWSDKAIWVGFPGAIYSLGPEETIRYALSLLREMGTGDRLVIAMSTENLVSNENLLALTSVLERATLPLSSETIDAIEGGCLTGNGRLHR